MPTPVSSLKKEYLHRKSEHYKTTWYDTPNISIKNSKLHKTHTTRPKIKVFIDTDAKPSSRPSAAVSARRSGPGATVALSSPARPLVSSRLERVFSSFHLALATLEDDAESVREATTRVERSVWAPAGASSLERARRVGDARGGRWTMD